MIIVWRTPCLTLSSGCERVRCRRQSCGRWRRAWMRCWPNCCLTWQCAVASAVKQQGQPPQQRRRRRRMPSRQQRARRQAGPLEGCSLTRRPLRRHAPRSTPPMRRCAHLSGVREGANMRPPRLQCHLAWPGAQLIIPLCLDRQTSHLFCPAPGVRRSVRAGRAPVCCGSGRRRCGRNCDASGGGGSDARRHAALTLEVHCRHAWPRPRVRTDTLTRQVSRDIEPFARPQHFLHSTLQRAQL